jgi:hypothetical protein
MNPEWWAPIAGVSGLIFGAGVSWALLERLRKDVNGLGFKMRRFERNAVLFAIAITERREDRLEIFRAFKE